MPSIGGFRGSNDPTPPAMNIFGVKISRPDDVVASHSLSFFSIELTLWLREKLVLKGLICFSKLSINDCPVHSGNPGIS